MCGTKGGASREQFVSVIDAKSIPMVGEEAAPGIDDAYSG